MRNYWPDILQYTRWTMTRLSSNHGHGVLWNSHRHVITSVIRQKGESRRVFQENKARQIFRKTNISYTLLPMITAIWYEFAAYCISHTGTYHGHLKVTIHCVYYATILGQCPIFAPPENDRKPKVFWHFQGV